MLQSDFERFADEFKNSLNDKAAPTLNTISAAALQEKDIPPIRFVVEGLLPAGLNIILCSIACTAVIAALFPHKEEEKNETAEGGGQ